VFDCAFKPRAGSSTIHYLGHLKMMAAVQPFLSGAISKTINMPADATVDEVAEAYLTGWKLGLKAIAIYRDGSKRTQPLNLSTTPTAPSGGGGAAHTVEGEKFALSPAAEAREVRGGVHRRKLPDERRSITHKFDIAGHEGYITVGVYEDGNPGEIFVSMSKQGSTISGLMDSFATAISYALQYGVPLQFLVDKFAHMRFEPSGFTKNPQIPYAKSIVDYLFRWLASKFLDEQAKHDVGVVSPALGQSEVVSFTNNETGERRNFIMTKMPRQSDAVMLAARNRDSELTLSTRQSFINQADAPPCPDCGCIMVRNGTCYKCLNCGTTSGCS
jgi:ribonucleoside-diphosphate reductase alpha chain